MKKIKGLLLLSAAIFAVARVYGQDVTTTTTTTVTVVTAPPELPVYEQPACPVDGYLWVPGYWAYDQANGYFWVPGVWVAPPEAGLLWTPAYWGFADGVYGFHEGYWGAEIGYYGGINYGFGYGGVGFVGGSWDGGNFRYNTAVVNVNAAVVHNTYVDRTVIADAHNRSSFNGPGGAQGKPTSDELLAMNQKHIAPTADQASQQHAASQDRNQYASMNRGHPASAAMKTVSGAAIKTQPHSPDNTARSNDHPAVNTPLADKKPIGTDPVADKKTPESDAAADKPMNANDIALANRAKQKAAAANSPAGTNANPGPTHGTVANSTVNRPNNNTGTTTAGQNNVSRRSVNTAPQAPNAARQTVARAPVVAQPAARAAQAPRTQPVARVQQTPKVQLPAAKKTKP